MDALWNLAPHDISILLYWLGILRFRSGTVAHLHVSWLDPNKFRRMTVVESKKMVVYDDVTAENKVQLFDKGIDRRETDRNLGRFEDFAQFQLLQRAGDLLIPRIKFTEPLKEEAAHFVECIKPGYESETFVEFNRNLLLHFLDPGP